MTYNELREAWKHDKVWTSHPKKNRTPYEKRKALARCLAMDWQYEFEHGAFGYWEMFKCQQFFENIGKRYGLLTEFRENGII